MMIYDDYFNALRIADDSFTKWWRGKISKKWQDLYAEIQCKFEKHEGNDINAL